LRKYQKSYALKASLLEKVASKRLVEQEEATKKLPKESRKLMCDFNLAHATNLDLEKKVTELADALKKFQDEKKIIEDEKKVTEEALENSKKDLEKLQKTHDEDLRLIENLRMDHDKSSKAAEHFRVNNADLAKTISSKERKIRDLEKALADQDETSEQEINSVKTKLKLLFEEYGKALKDFGTHPGPLPEDEEISSLLSWIEEEFQAISGGISSTSDFAAAFSVESILKLLHDFECADLLKFRGALLRFPNARSTSRIHPNEDVEIIKARFTQEFWFARGKELVKKIARARL
jgi:DNA repair exonuclease SbcCD ATPase subunit